MDDAFSLYVTFVILGCAIAGFAWAIWDSRRPREFGRIRLIPTTPLLFFCIVTATLMLARLVSIMGGGRHHPI
jgi:hypothetical protein